MEKVARAEQPLGTADGTRVVESTRPTQGAKDRRARSAYPGCIGEAGPIDIARAWRQEVSGPEKQIYQLFGKQSSFTVCVILTRSHGGEG